MRVPAPIPLLRFAFLAGVASAAISAPPASSTQNVPPELKPPDGQTLLWHWTGKGNQIYTCQDIAGAYAWKLKGPEAKLFDSSGNLQGRHFTGPTWEANDGSRVTGKMVTNVQSPDSGAIPWLLVAAAAHNGAGAMHAVETIQRRQTKGGVAPAAGCDAAGINSEVSAPYEASYYFYGRAAL